MSVPASFDWDDGQRHSYGVEARTDGDSIELSTYNYMESCPVSLPRDVAVSLAEWIIGQCREGGSTP